MVRASFQLVPGLGAAREQRLWQAGARDWSELTALTSKVTTTMTGTPSSDRSALVPARLRAPLLSAIAAGEAALTEGALPLLAEALPRREHWRLFGAFSERAVFLDIETDVMDGITVIGLLDHRGPRLLRAGHDLALLPHLVPPSSLLVTFNGASFDVPHLRRAFPDWQPPAAHIDLRPILARLGQTGGLKQIEQNLGLGRPQHLRGLDGSRAAWLWRHADNGSLEALRLLAEYNLYDAINLRPLCGIAYNHLASEAGFPTTLPVSYRGDVLYDVSKILLAL